MALNHLEPDRIPSTWAAPCSPASTSMPIATCAVTWGYPTRCRIMDVFQQIAVVDEDVRQSWAAIVATWRRARRPPSKIVVDEDSMRPAIASSTTSGDRLAYAWDGGFYGDMFHHPFANSTSIDDIKNFPWPDPWTRRFATPQESARHVAEDLGEPVILGGLAAGFVELAAWTAALPTSTRPGHQSRLDDLPDGYHHRPEAGLLGGGAAACGRLCRRGAGGR